jgi:AAA domain
MTVRMDMGGARREREQEQREQTKAKGNGKAQIGAQQTAAPAQAPRKLDFVWADDIEPAIAEPGLVEGLLGLVGITVAYGESTAGKTFVIVDLSCCIASQRFWRGLDIEPGVVVYIAAEAPKSVERRVWAWKRYHNVDHVPLVVVRSTVNLLSADTDAILALLAEIRREHGRIALVVIDTLARAMIGNESSSEDMGQYVAACSRIREEAQTQVLSVHHCGKDTAKGARGWSGLRAATDVELEIGGECIRVTKNRDERSGQTYGFKLEEVELGTNSKGRTITTCVAVESDLPPARKRKHKRGTNEQIVFEALTAGISDNPRQAPAAKEIPPHVQGATVEQWREAAMRYLPQEGAYRKKEAFKRAMLSLVASQEVHHVDGFAWLP